MKNRSRSDIVADILELAQGGAIKTRIMNEAFLSFDQVQRYIKLLTDQGLLRYDEQEKKFYTTEEGTLFLKKCREMRKMFNPGDKGSKAARSEG